MRLRKLFADFANAVLRLCQRNAWFWIALGVVSVLIAAVVVATKFWCWLGAGESGSTTIRNLGLVIAAIVALPLAIWRSKVAERQAETAQRQAETAQRGLLNERYQKGAEMLGSSVLTVRLGGIYALGRLAREHSGDYHIQIMSLFCVFVRNPPPEEKETKGTHKLREDVQAVMTVICERGEPQIEIEKKEGYWMDLNEVNLADAYLPGVNLARAHLWKADLTCARLPGANLSGARLLLAKLGSDLTGGNLSRALASRVDLAHTDLTGADLKNAHLYEANLHGAILPKADLTEAMLHEANLTEAHLSGARLLRADLKGADLGNCRGLTQAQLNEAVADLDHPPDLTGSVDADTGEPLVWRGASPSG